MNCSTVCRLAGSVLAMGIAIANQPARANELSPVVVEGVVPDEATRTAVIQQVRGIYGSHRVMDRLEVAQVTAPANWSRYLSQAITTDLKKVSAGELDVDGNAIRLRGRVADADISDALEDHMKAAFNSTYDLKNELTVIDTLASQGVLDQTLALRTVQFESGSAVLTSLGRMVLDDMAAAIIKVGVPKLDIIGHTDSVGERQANILLSVQRADAVKAYLAQRGITPDHMIVSGRGPDLPVSENVSAAGRARNRRIEFVIRRS
jgi:OOP family OmpA-OmpF porin